MSLFGSGDSVFVLKKSIDKRRKKRRNQKRRKIFRRQQMEEKFKNREKLHKTIDQWLMNKREEVEKVKMVCTILCYSFYSNGNKVIIIVMVFAKLKLLNHF